MTRARKELGGKGEQIAARFLEKNGYRIEARNFRSPTGEIDLIATKDGFLIFVEVKTRTAGSKIHPSLSITSGKQARVRKVGEYYCSSHPWLTLQPRFDVVTVELDSREETVEHLINAF